MHKEARIFVAGHKGLVGRALLKNLQDRGYSNFICKDRKELDLLDQAAVRNFFAKERIEYVFVAAAKVGGILANTKYRADFIYENLQIQNNIIHQSYLHGVKKLLFLGSTCIYPKNAPQAINEDALLTSQLEYTNEPYAIAKIAGIKMCESYNIQYHTNFISVMPTNLYGKHDNFDLETSHVLPALLRKLYLATLLSEDNMEAILKNVRMKNTDEARIYLENFGIYKDRVEIWGSGNARREFLYSEDMADACVFIMENVDFKDLISDTKEPRNTHINIGTGVDISIKDLAYLIKELVGFKGHLYFNTQKPGGVMAKLSNPHKLHKLGWKASTSLQEGIKNVFDWYKKEE